MDFQQKLSPEVLYRKTRDLILQTLEGLMPEDYDFSELLQILGEHQTNSTYPLEMTYTVLKYFAKTVGESCVSNILYHRLQLETQKQEALIRNHIKTEQEMKMYMDHIQTRVTEFETLQLATGKQDTRQLLAQILSLKQAQTILLNQKISLFSENNDLRKEIQKKNEHIRQLELKSNIKSFKHPIIQDLNLNSEFKRQIPFQGSHSYRKMDQKQNAPKQQQQRSNKTSSLYSLWNVADQKTSQHYIPVRGNQNCYQLRNQDSKSFNQSSKCGVSDRSYRKTTEQSTLQISQKINEPIYKPLSWIEKEKMDCIPEYCYAGKDYKRVDYEKKIGQSSSRGNLHNNNNENKLSPDMSKKSLVNSNSRVNFNQNSRSYTKRYESHYQTQPVQSRCMDKNRQSKVVVHANKSQLSFADEPIDKSYNVNSKLPLNQPVKPPSYVAQKKHSISHTNTITRQRPCEVQHYPNQIRQRRTVNK